MDLEFSPSVLDTPSLITPNIAENTLVYRPSYSTTLEVTTPYTNNHHHSTSDASSTNTTSDESSLSLLSADIKVSKIEDDLKQSLSQSRKPTESPFFSKYTASSDASTDKHTTATASTTDDGIPVNVPSTAEVVSAIESFSKDPTKHNAEHEPNATTADIIVSPKKKLIMRSQSRTDSSSSMLAAIDHLSQLKHSQLDEEGSLDDHHHTSTGTHFQRLHDLPLVPPMMESRVHMDNGLESVYVMQGRSEQGNMMISHKRAFQPMPTGVSVSKANMIAFSQQPIIDEVTSTDQLPGSKRARLNAIPTSTHQFRSSLPSSSSSSSSNDKTNNNNNSNLSDDQRKKQIRDSNREAARRCRERRRNYIEQLEGNLEQHKLQIKQLSEKVSRAERDNTQLRAMLGESKLFQPRLPSNDSSLEFSTLLIPSNGMELKLEGAHRIDGNLMQRSYVARNTH